MTEPDVAEVFFLVALIIFLVGAFIAFQVQTMWAALVSLGLASVAFGWFAL